MFRYLVLLLCTVALCVGAARADGTPDDAALRALAVEDGWNVFSGNPVVDCGEEGTFDAGALVHDQQGRFSEWHRPAAHADPVLPNAEGQGLVGGEAGPGSEEVAERRLHGDLSVDHQGYGCPP